MTQAEYDSLFRMDFTAFSVSTMDEDSVERVWLTRSPEARLAGIEHLRRTFYGDAPTQSSFPRFLELAQRA